MKKYLWMSFAAVVIGSLRVNNLDDLIQRVGKSGSLNHNIAFNFRAFPLLLKN